MKTNKTIFESGIGKVALGVTALLLGLGVGTAQAATIFTDNGTDSRVSNTDNWNNGLPTGGSNPGTVPTGFSTTYNASFTDYDITFNGNSSVSGASYLTVRDGASVTFNDDTVLTATGDRTFLGGGTSASSLTFNDNASGSVGGSLFYFGIYAESGLITLSLTGNSSLSLNVGTVNKNSSGHVVNLSDSAVWETIYTNWYLSHGLKVNFEQADQYFTPIWKIPEAKKFSGVTGVTFQINGVDTTLADERFVLTEGVDGFNTLSLTVIPEPKGTVFSIK